MEERKSLAFGDLSKRTFPRARTAQCLPPQQERDDVPASVPALLVTGESNRPTRSEIRISLQSRPRGGGTNTLGLSQQSPLRIGCRSPHSLYSRPPAG